MEFVRGDMYLAQMKATKGHTALITCCEWDPLNKASLMTCSHDSTIRIWDANDKKEHKRIIVGKQRVGFEVASFAPDGTLIIGAYRDGVVQMWDTKGTFARPEATIVDKIPEACSIAWDSKSQQIGIRSLGDASMRLYDARLLKEPVHVWRNAFATTGNPQHVSCLFSPDDSLLVTGAANRLYCYSKRTFGLVQEIPVEMAAGSSLTCLSWNSKLNQIICGTTDGSIKVLYDPELSTNGVLLCVAKRTKRQNPQAALEWQPGMGQVINPLLEEEERKQRDKNRLTRKQRANAARPELPISGVGVGGQTGTSVQHELLKKLLKLNEYVPEDPRTALLKYDAVAKSDPRYFAAYQETQPEPEYDYQGLEEELARKELEAKRQQQNAQPKK